jgi:O-antigen/teichoic acid export membrane protein
MTPTSTTRAPRKPSSRLARLASDSGLYVLGNVMRRSLSVVTMPVFTRYLSTSGYGVLAIVGTIQNMLEVFYELGVGSAATRSFYDSKEEGPRRVLFGTLLVFSVGATTALTVLLLALGPWLWAMAQSEIPFYPYLGLTILTVFVGNIAVLPRALFRVLNQVPTFFKLSLAQAVLTAGLAVAFVVWLDLGPLGPVLATFAGAVVFFAVYATYLRPHVQLAFRPEIVRQSLAFGAPEIPLRWGRWALRTADRLILQRFASLAAVGIYSVGSSVSKMGFDLVANGIHWALVPFFYSTATEESDGRSRRLFARIATYNLLILVALGLGTLVFGRDLIHLLASAKYAEAERVMPLIVAASVLEASFYIPSKGLYLMRRTGLLLPLFLVPALLNVGLNLVLVPAMGMMGAAWSALIGYSVMITASLIVSQRVYHIPYEYGRLARVLLAGPLVWGVTLALPDVGLALGLALKTLALALYPLLLLVTGFFTADELAWARRAALLARVRAMPETGGTR